MNYGAKPTVASHKDYDFIRTMGAPTSPKFPPEYDTDANVWTPDQNAPQSVLGGIPALPYGCTEYVTADLDNDLSGKLQSNPNTLENILHASAQGGADVRTVLMAATAPNTLHPERLGWLGNIFNVRAQGALDWFDAIRYAQLQGGFEKRSVSWGTPWFPSWENACLRGEYIMPMPTNDEMRNVDRIGWHNSKFFGWEQVNGSPMLKNKSLQGAAIGKNGIIVFPREVVNAVMTIRGTCAFTASNYDGDIKRVSLPIVQMILSYLRSMFSYSYGGTQGMLWDTPAHIRRNVRVMCDDAGLSYALKNTICAIIKQESNWNPKAKNIYNSNGTKDYGLLQINDHKGYWIGEGLYFSSVDEVLNNPEKSVKFVIGMAKKGKLYFWSSYKFGAYRKWLLSESVPSKPY